MPYQSKPKPSSPTTKTPRYHYYTLPIIDSSSPTSDTPTTRRHLITFPSQKRKQRFLIYLRDFCQARRRGEWAAIPRDQNFEKALEYAVVRKYCVYDLGVGKVPVDGGSGGIGRKHVCEFMEECKESLEEGDVGEEDITDMDIKNLHF